jgi:glycosyltransferase involved in cell wall biosynthesis
MRIALIVTDLSNTRIGGISRVATELGAQFALLGHHVAAYVLARPGRERTSSYRGIHLRHIDPFWTLNSDYPVIGFSRRAFARLRGDLQADRFDLVQAFNLNATGAIPYARTLAEHRIPLVVSHFETLAMDVRAKRLEFRSLPSGRVLLQILYEALLALTLERRYLACAHRVVTEDEHTRQALLRLGVSPERIRVIPSGVDLAAAGQATAPSVDVLQGKAGPIIGYVGRADPRKGVQHLIVAMTRVRAHHPEAVLFVAGGSRHGYDAVLRRLITSHGLNDTVRLLGRIDGDILPYYKLADLIVIPSLSEGIPITMGEAMAARVPVVITRLPGVLSFVHPPDLVHWAEIADPDSLAQAILTALQDPARVDRSARAFAFIAHHTWRAVADRYLAVYQDLLAFTAVPTGPPRPDTP